MKAYRGIKGIAPLILILSSKWRRMINFMSTPLYLWRNSFRYLLNRRLGEPQSQSGCSGEGIKLLPLLGTKPQNAQSITKSV